jgi:hypothetical protein
MTALEIALACMVKGVIAECLYRLKRRSLSEKGDGSASPDNPAQPLTTQKFFASADDRLGALEHRPGER